MSSTMTSAPGFDGELRHRQPDGAGPDHQGKLVRLHRRALHGVRADAQRFDEGELVQRQGGRGMQLARRDDELLAHPAVGVDAEHLDGRAGVGLAPAAGDTFLAVDVRLDRAAVAGRDVGHALADRHHLDAEFVAEDARVGEKGCLPLKAWMSVPHTPMRCTRTSASPASGRGGGFGRQQGQTAGFFESDRFHKKGGKAALRRK